MSVLQHLHISWWSRPQYSRTIEGCRLLFDVCRLLVISSILFQRMVRSKLIHSFLRSTRMRFSIFLQHTSLFAIMVLIWFFKKKKEEKFDRSWLLYITGHDLLATFGGNSHDVQSGKKCQIQQAEHFLSFFLPFFFVELLWLDELELVDQEQHWQPLTRLQLAFADQQLGNSPNVISTTEKRTTGSFYFIDFYLSLAIFSFLVKQLSARKTD